jgi:hypothetical protein
MSARPAPSFFIHFVVALGLAYGLSVFFWLGLGVFNLAGFIVVSALAALAGLLTGWFGNKRLWLTALATVLIRLGLYAFMMRG